MTRIIIFIEPKTSEALRGVAATERRTPRDQAALFVRERLIQIGALPSPPAPAPTPQPAESQR